MSARAGEDKAVLLLRSLPPDVTEAVLAHLEPALGGRLRARLQGESNAAPSDALQPTLREFLTQLPEKSPNGKDGQDGSVTQPDPAAGAPVTAAEPVHPSRAISDQPTAPAGPVDPIAELGELELPRLVAVLREERVPTVVLVLSCLGTARVGEVLKGLPVPVRREAALKLGQATPRNAELLKRVARAVVVKGRSLQHVQANPDEDPRVKKLAELLRGLDREDRAEILNTLTQNEPDLAVKVKALLYLFEDLLHIQNRSVQAILAQVDAKTLAVALRGATPEIQARIMDNLSARARENLAEEISLLASASATQIKEAQARVAEVIQQIDQEGKLEMLE